jgi:membrane-bound ClpP family serine protease
VKKVEEEKKTEGQRILKALENSIIITVFIVLAAWLFGLGFYFGEIVSTMGFALFFLFFYATR